MTEADDPNLRERRRRNRLIILAIVGVFLLPFLIAALWYANIHDWGYETMPHGRLVSPPLALRPPPLRFALVRHGRLSPSYFRGRWTLMYIGRPDCLPDCREALYATRQIRLAMGVNITRVQRIYLVMGHPTKTGFLEVEDPDLTVVDADTPRGRRFVARILRTVHGRVGREIYVVDPEGRLMMTYPAGADPMILLHDMQRLISLSPTD
jgi:hypothetical protein